MKKIIYITITLVLSCSSNSGAITADRILIKKFIEEAERRISGKQYNGDEIKFDLEYINMKPLLKFSRETASHVIVVDHQFREQSKVPQRYQGKYYKINKSELTPREIKLLKTL